LKGLRECEWGKAGYQLQLEDACQYWGLINMFETKSPGVPVQTSLGPLRFLEIARKFRQKPCETSTPLSERESLPTDTVIRER